MFWLQLSHECISRGEIMEVSFGNDRGQQGDLCMFGPPFISSREEIKDFFAPEFQERFFAREEFEDLPKIDVHLVKKTDIPSAGGGLLDALEKKWFEDGGWLIQLP